MYWHNVTQGFFSGGTCRNSVSAPFPTCPSQLLISYMGMTCGEYLYLYFPRKSNDVTYNILQAVSAELLFCKWIIVAEMFSVWYNSQCRCDRFWYSSDKMLHITYVCRVALDNFWIQAVALMACTACCVKHWLIYVCSEYVVLSKESFL